MRLVQGALSGVAVTLVVGFGFANWHLGGTTNKLVKEASEKATVTALAPICADKFRQAADAPAQLAALQKENSWQRSDFVLKGGWATLPGMKTPDTAVARACAEMLEAQK